jgi:hypothetical protein
MKVNGTQKQAGKQNKGLVWKVILILLLIPVCLLGGVLGMWAGEICPPQGPWPQPPWCEAQSPAVYLVLGQDTHGYNQQIDFPKFNDVMGYLGSRVFVSHHFEPNLPEYIKGNYASNGKALNMGILMGDYWGSRFGLIKYDFGENTADNIDSSMDRVQSLGADLAEMTDFWELTSDFQIAPLSDDYAYSRIPQEGLNHFAQAAEKRGMKSMLIVQLFDAAGMDTMQWLHKDISQTAGVQLWDKNLPEETWDRLFEQHTEYIMKSAQRAEAAGFDFFVINMGDAGTAFLQDRNAPRFNQYYTDLANQVRTVYSGKVGMFLWLNTMRNNPTHIRFLDALDFVVLSFDIGVDHLEPTFNVDATDVGAMQQAWETYFSDPAWQALQGKETFLCAMIFSYDGFFQKGWLPIGPVRDETVDYPEQAIGYESLFRALYENDFPVHGVIAGGYEWLDRNVDMEAKVIPDDRESTIRNKPAEQIFYRWAKIFQ